MPLYQFLQGTLRRRRHWVLARETQQNEDKNNSPIHASPAPCVIHICRRKHLTACTVVHYSLLIKPLTSFFKVERWHKCMNVVWSCLFVFLIHSGQHWFNQYLFSDTTLSWFLFANLWNTWEKKNLFMYIDILLMIRLRRLEKTLPRLYRYMCYSNENNCETMINLYLHAVCSLNLYWLKESATSLWMCIIRVSHY